YLCMHLTAALGLPTADVDMHTFAKKSALVVTRFDRQWTSDQRLLRLPQEDCCQALSVPPTSKYESHGGPGIEDILKLLQASDQPETDQHQFFKTQVVFWLLGATDGHAKNFSLFILPGGRFRLTPLYDVMSVQPNVDSGHISYERMKFSMAVGKGRKYGVDEIMPKHFIETAMQFGLSTAFIQRIFNELKQDAETAIDTTLKTLPAGFPENLAKSVVDGFRKRINLIA
ncbi:MAG: HipA domain-containing protein, partial [Gammaproteobacteria bacterium]|nr:HipA domain-containing protein [Gammaproteobacteria bacterium]